MIDTHCHLTFDRLRDRLDEVLADAAAAGVDRMISVGTTPADARAAVQLAEAHESIHATVGMHPLYADERTDPAEVIHSLHELAGHSRVVALGEMGLDRHYNKPPLTLQQRFFAAQLEAIADADVDSPLGALPVVIHNRKATEQVLAMIDEAGLAGERFVFHCFTGDTGEARQILDSGALISFTGIVTFANAGEVADAADYVPLDRMMVETDAPFLTPEPHRKVRVNEPRYVVDVARFLARRRRMPEAAFIEQMDANARAFFKL